MLKEKTNEDSNSKEGQVSDKDTGKQQVYWSAPPNIDFKRKSQTKLMADTLKGQSKATLDEAEGKVHIPKTFEDSDSDSDSFDLKLGKLTGMGDLGQSSSKDKLGDPNNQLQFVETEARGIVPQKLIQDIDADNKINNMLKGDIVDCVEAKDPPVMMNTLSPEIFMTDDNIINTQESVGQTEQPAEKVAMNESCVKDTSIVVDDKKTSDQVLPAKRRSERLKKVDNLTTMEKTEIASKKRNLEGNSSKSNSFSVLAVDDVMHITSEMGVVIDNDVFDTCNLINDLETARHDLYLKQLEQNVVTQNGNGEECPADSKSPELCQIQEISSDSEDFILVESRRKKDRIKNLSKFLLNALNLYKVKNILAHR